MGVSDNKTPNTERKNSGDHPPTYTQTTDQFPGVPVLNLSQNAGPAKFTTVTHYECIAHLKFLAALSDLRDTVTSIPDLFSISDPNPQDFGSHNNEAWALIKEKRWAVYTAKAVERYTVWWNECVPASQARATVDLLQSKSYDDITTCGSPLVWARDDLPPLDVLMVWHAHMLNPRAFLEDCIRYGKISFWYAGFPWEIINACIDDQTLAYDAGRKAADTFLLRTHRKWDNLQDMSQKLLQCHNCDNQYSAPWTGGTLTLPLDRTFDNWHGFADKDFRIRCARCNIRITHEILKVQKFRTDVKDLMDSNIPMPGTLYNLWGVPQVQSRTRRRRQLPDFPNRLIKAAKRNTRGNKTLTLWFCPNVRILSTNLANLLQDRETMRAAGANLGPSSLYKEEKIALRRMMSRYWDNSSQFALDLVGAVVRQGTFVQKMDNIDWLHSPTLTETMLRLIRKYAVFFQIMSSNPGRMAVPTLDVDLAWHTHQLSPGRYFEYSVHRTEKDGSRAIFIDHDDKVSEIKLSDGFEWTSKMYRKLTDGGIYSECTCWYCEATRASDLQGRIFIPSSSGSKARSAAANLHDNPQISSNPDQNPHISAHSAVKTRDAKVKAAEAAAGKSSSVDPCYVKFLKLRSEYEKSCRRADKRSSQDGKSKDDRYDPSYGYALMWGYPIYVPYYAPYTCDPSVHSDIYAADPSCMSFAPGTHGSCVSGTCGGAVAAGGCGGKGGGCSGGCAGGSSGGGGGGGCGGGGGGGSGSGGGGGCGGGGGGC